MWKNMARSLSVEAGLRMLIATCGLFKNYGTFSTKPGLRKSKVAFVVISYNFCNNVAKTFC